MRNSIGKPLLVTLLGAGLCAGALLAEQPDEARARSRAASTKDVEPGIRKYHITASEGEIVPGHIRVKLGQKVRLTFVRKDDTYGIRFKDFGITEKLTPERPLVFELTPQKVGTFEFRCSRNWGIKRFNNNGALVVTQ